MVIISTLDTFLHIYKKVRPSIGQSVASSVGQPIHPCVGTSAYHAFIRITTFERIRARVDLLDLLDAFLHLYKRVFPSIGLSVHPSVCHTFVNKKLNIDENRHFSTD